MLSFLADYSKQGVFGVLFVKDFFNIGIEQSYK